MPSIAFKNSLRYSLLILLNVSFLLGITAKFSKIILTLFISFLSKRNFSSLIHVMYAITTVLEG